MESKGDQPGAAAGEAGDRAGEKAGKGAGGWGERRVGLDIVGSSDPYQQPSQTWPTLSREMLERIKAYGKPDHFDGGANLFVIGERDVDFFVILDGAVDILESDGRGGYILLVTLVNSQFTGEADLLTHRGGLVTARAHRPTDVVRIPAADFQRMMRAEPDISDIVMLSFVLRRLGLIRHAAATTVIVGNLHHADTLRLQGFLTRNGHPLRVLDTASDPEAASMLARFDLGPEALPVVILEGSKVLQNPSNRELADALGISEHINPRRIYDVAVVGAGPAGLAAAVYAASEGLDTIVIEANMPGGQAACSSRIENYLGFPLGISGLDLSGRAQIQAHKFGARLAVARAATSLLCKAIPFRIQLEDGEWVTARAVVVATGARYRRLDVPDLEHFEGQGVHYAATSIEGRLCGGSDVAVVGGGNSAGQAAVFLAGKAKHVHLLVRHDSLTSSMSDYLIGRIKESPRITLHTNTEVTSLHGDKYLQAIGWRVRGGPESIHPVNNLFLMIGAVPNTGWLCGCLSLDRAGFVETGRNVDPKFAVSPYATSVPGIFAVGDVRAGSVKRVAAGVGAGSVVVHSVHRWLASLAPAHTLARQGNLMSEETEEPEEAADLSRVPGAQVSRKPGAGHPTAN